MSRPSFAFDLIGEGYECRACRARETASRADLHSKMKAHLRARHGVGDVDQWHLADDRTTPIVWAWPPEAV